VIKLADRLHNMRTLTFLPRPKQEQKAKETLEILAPLAHRLGMNTIKWELEDLAFNTLFPKKFEEIHRLIDEHAPQRDGLLRAVTNRVQTDLKGAKVKADVTGRPKHLYSIYQKMISRSRPVQGLHRDAEVQHVPVAAHDGDRPDRQAGGDADPDDGDAPHRRVRHRGALAVQGDQGRDGRRTAGAHRRDDVAAPAAGLAARGF
jgi:hypothetical protein